MDITELVKSRRSIRRFKSTKVSRELVTAILDLARWSPSAHNAQPWRIIVIDDDKVKKKLAAKMGKAWLFNMLKDGVPKEEAEKIVKVESLDRITKSPIVMIACVTLADMHKYPDPRRRKAEYLMATQSVAAYIQTLLLLAHHHGLGACWICAPLFCQDTVKEVLRLPKEFEPQAMVIMGHANEKPRLPQRKPLNEICAFNGWASS
ncbi:MAG: nitroreductase family protein [Candidatus Bathyarchaeota archaeon]|nr:nitroreductase family protein [Candidatus Bathyarchaeota archaeon A05DMB-5]MDH7557590.1 nitroreductase family protein [Candidatus Bathyarchaeota archaeon]